LRIVSLHLALGSIGDDLAAQQTLAGGLGARERRGVGGGDSGGIARADGLVAEQGGEKGFEAGHRPLGLLSLGALLGDALGGRGLGAGLGGDIEEGRGHVGRQPWRT
jgi:hypothetical protein